MKSSLRIVTENMVPSLHYQPKAPADCVYRPAYMTAGCWTGNALRITLQQHNAKHALVYFLEIRAGEPQWINLHVDHPDLFGIYALNNPCRLHTDKETAPLLHLEDDHYSFVYCPAGNCQLHAAAGTTVVALYSVAISWFKRYQHSYLSSFRELLEEAGSRPTHFSALEPLAMHALIRDEWLLLASLPPYEGIQLDAELYRPIATLLHTAQSDLSAGKPKTYLLHERLAAVKHHIGQLALHAADFSVELVAGHFGFSQRHLIREFRREYHITPKQYYLAIHLGECRRLLRDERLTVSEVAYKRGYTDLSSFLRQYKKQFGHRPGDVGPDMLSP